MPPLEQSESVLDRLRSRVLGWWGRNPVFVVLWVSFVVTWALQIPTSQGSGWDSFLVGASWLLLISTGVVGLVGGRDSSRAR